VLNMHRCITPDRQTDKQTDRQSATQTDKCVGELVSLYRVQMVSSPHV
jgi:hypothetical protein